MRLHQAAAGVLMGGIEIDDGGRDLSRQLFRNIIGQAGFEAPHEPFMDGLALGENPDPERRIEIVDAIEQAFVEPRGVEQQGVDACVLRELQDAFHVDIDLPVIESDGKTPGGKAGKSGVFENLAQLAHDLAQRGARLFLVRAAPQQSNQPLAAFLLDVRQSEVAEHRGRLASPQLHRAAVEAQCEAPDQRNGKASRPLRCGDRLSCSLDARNASHRKSFAVRCSHVKPYER
jgi:hypothetical protein